VLRSALAAKSFGICHDSGTAIISFKWFKYNNRSQMPSFNPRKLSQKAKSNRVGKDTHSLSRQNLNLKNMFKVCKSVHHRTIQINHQPDGTIFQYIILTFICSSTCFGRFPAHHQEFNDCSGSLWFYLRCVPTLNTEPQWVLHQCLDKKSINAQSHSV
jgi:hypothetical protein